MADRIKTERAEKVYADLCETLDKHKLKYEKYRDKLTVVLNMEGDSMPVKLIISVDAERQILRLVSQLPFRFSEAKRVNGAIAVCVASYGLAHGCFDYELTTGKVTFRMAQPFHESRIGENVFAYMIVQSNAIINKYNGRFLAIENGILDINEFIACKY